jgi:hypothetical protein
MNFTQRKLYVKAQGAALSGTGYYADAETAFQACIAWHEKEVMKPFGIRIMAQDFDAFFDGYKEISDMRCAMLLKVASYRQTEKEILAQLENNAKSV